MKIKEQTRKLAVGCSKHCFEVADRADVVYKEIFEEYYHHNIHKNKLSLKENERSNDQYKISENMTIKGNFLFNRTWDKIGCKKQTQSNINQK